MNLNQKITSQIFSDYLNCEYKAYLKTTGKDETITDFQSLNNEILQSVRQQYRERFCENLTSFFGDPVAKTSILSQTLKNGFEKIFNASIENKELETQIDVIEKISCVSSSKDFSYIPISILPNYRVSRNDKLLLAFSGLVLSDLQNKEVEIGKIFYGYPLKFLTVNLKPLISDVLSIINDIRKSLVEKKVPKHILNSYCEICAFKHICYQKAFNDDNLSLLRGLKKKDIQVLNNKGIFTVLQFSYTFRPRRKIKKRKKQIGTKHIHSLKAMAIREQKVYIYKELDFPKTKVRVYFDVEGDPDRDLFYLLGILIDKGNSLERHSYWLDSEFDKEKIVEEFLDYFDQLKDFTVFHYGSYEIRFLKSLLKSLDGRRESSITRIIENSINVLSTVYTSIYFPTYSNGLKEISNYLGFEWSEHTASGLYSIMWRRLWEINHDEELYKKLILYNIEDCLALKKLTELILFALQDEETLNTEFSSIEITSEFYGEISQRYGGRNFGLNKFALDDFDFINKRAYFDYQRNKVFIRTEKRLDRIKKQVKQGVKFERKINQEINIETSKVCLNCGSSDVYKLSSTVSKVVVDLKFFNGGIKRWITKYNCSHGRCRTCKKQYLSKEYKDIRVKYGHNLISWVIYQNIVNQISFEKIEKTLADSFQISIGKVGLGNSYYFKKIAADYYLESYEEIARRIQGWKIIHVDETRASVGGENGYVWVFTNMTEVYFLYTETRKTDFIPDIMRDFSGVLISDFYKGYDSINCEQQKCLIHLMRDVNDALFKYQQDEGLIFISRNFSSLLKMIVETIDKYGLKKRHLNKHKKDVDKFYRLLHKNSLESEISVKLKDRFEKNREKLFLFLDRDGVPWNNNNAEHAFKHFATYRRDTDGVFTEEGLKKYLILLSIYETCNYQGINFLDFLLSKEKDIYSYLEKNAVLCNRVKSLPESPISRT